MRKIGVIGKPLMKVKHSPVTLDLASATKAFDKTRTILTCMWGVTGIPLAYVIQQVLKPPPKDEDPPFGETKSEYTSIDQELIARAPILHKDANTTNKDINLEADCPFDLSFLTDLKKVWAILYALFSASAVW